MLSLPSSVSSHLHNLFCFQYESDSFSKDSMPLCEQYGMAQRPLPDGEKSIIYIYANIFNGKTLCWSNLKFTYTAIEILILFYY